MENREPGPEMTGSAGEMELTRRRDLAQKLGTAGWALFFIWVGIALLAQLEIGIGMLGVGIITLGMQLLRGVLKIGFEGFWVFVGLLFVLGGVWVLLEPQFSLVPVLLIAAGVLLLLSIFRHGHRA